MRKLMVLVVVAIMATAGFVAAQSITGSSHDLSSTSGNVVRSTNSDEICVFCHTPHQPTGQNTDPLWNHTLSAVAAYGVYASSTLDSVPTDIGGGATTSNLCMSCHDGTIAINSEYNPPNAIGANPTMTTVAGRITAGGLLDPANTANLGAVPANTTLINDHPVNMVYSTVLDGGLNADDGTGTAVGTLPLFGGSGATNTGLVQCASCHNAHDSTNASFLRQTISGSALCLTCHNK